MDQRENILKNVESLFMRFGFKSITMDDIANKLSISKKTIYQFFKDKDTLVTEFTIDFLTKQKNDLLKIKKDSKNVVDELYLTTDFLKTKVSNVNPVVLLDLRKYHPAAWKVFQEHRTVFIQSLISENIRNGIFDGYFRKNINIKIIARMRIEQIETAFNPDIFSPDEFNPADVQIQMFDHFIYGLCTLKGHQLMNEYLNIKE